MSEEATAASHPHGKESLIRNSWELDDLKHHDKPGEENKSRPSLADGGSPAKPSFIKRLHRPQHKKGKQDPLDWGQPGELTEKEVEVFVEFRKQVEKRGGDFRDTVYNFGEEEGEPFALCRWLRARKFDLEATITMVEEATEEVAGPRKFNYYPDPKDALGIEPHIYISQYPQLYTGQAKSGAPLFISKPGKLNVTGLTCTTTIDGILRYHWYAMMHDFANRLRAQKAKDPEFTRFACVIVMDLEGLSASQVTKTAQNIVQEQARIDSLCFPETMERMVIVNAPRFFSMTWKLVKGWIDARTASKVEIFSARSTWEKRLLEIIDEDLLPIDYGGKAEDTRRTLIKDAPDGMSRIFEKMMIFRGHDSVNVELNPGETMDIIVFTRSKAGAHFSVTDVEHRKGTFVDDVDVTHTGGDDLHKDHPTRVTVATKLEGPCKFKVKATSKAGRFASEGFLVVCNIF